LQVGFSDASDYINDFVSTLSSNVWQVSVVEVISNVGNPPVNVPAMGFIGITTLFIGLLMSGLRLTKK